MRRLLSLLLVLPALVASGQPLTTRWLSAPGDGTGEAVWFARTYTSRHRPLLASLALTTTGRVEVWVNDIPVTRHLLTPERGEADGRAIALTVEIGRYLRPDTNRIAILYIPTAAVRGGRHLAVCCYGQRADGSPFAYFADEGWLCAPAHTGLDGWGREWQDGGYRYTLPADSPQPDGGPARVSTLTATGAEEYQQVAYPCLAVTGMPRPRYFDPVAGGAEYEFGTAFYGLVRVTLRGMRRGQRVSVGGDTYICTGETDEQYQTRLAPRTLRRLRLVSAEGLRPAQIQSVEGMAMSRVWQTEYDE